MRSRILVVDDEPHILDVVRSYLEREGYEVIAAADGETALDLARGEDPDLLVLDVMLPERSGFDVLRAIRGEGSDVPVLMLTARDDVIDRVAGLELGADDYVVKPFEPREVVARVGAILRRTVRANGDRPNGERPATERTNADRPNGSTPAAGEPAVHQLFDLTIDLLGREALRGGQTIPLTRSELDLLALLAEQPGRVWTRDQIGDRLFGEAFGAFDRTIDSHVSNLRRKLGSRPDGGAYVETVRGIGYRAARFGETP